ncbi:MAG: DJ-1/PfpI family protein [Thiohalocapsa sp.]|jgi:4-methyl-5(b-hydroxyethyl)-thiazole monophosphate biosynthesis|uniref:DJ-1 family glyoxalase III n=1 Tax=Thiohalocapsa sp. TaxID=2497641 RepID=UPI0025E4A0D7|nr:DJ-1 family glyoxalase III [Thiohalocapsa sp.]MCG6941208.1 DJ-1/PfpI family protein [Thiohalocapsa sp.]
MARVLVPLAQGCEEVEAVTIIDLLRRAGIEVVTAGLDATPVQASRGTVLVPDTTLDAVAEDTFDMVALPGGQPGANNLNADPRLAAIVSRQATQGRWCAAICAAPLMLADLGLLDGRQATSFPGALDTAKHPEIRLSEDAVVTDGNLVTSRGPGTAMDFALQLIELLVGRERRDEVESKLMRPR